MRVVAIIYILLSVAANFWYGIPSTFALASLSFPLLVWLLLRKRKIPAKTIRDSAEVHQ